MTQPRKLCFPFSRASLCRYILHTFLVAAKRKLCFPFSRASLCRYILHTFLVAAKRKRLCRNPLLSLRATVGSVAISSITMRLLRRFAPRNDIMTQPRKLCFPFSRASLCHYILHTFLVAAKRKRLCRNPLLSLRATVGSVAISSITMRLLRRFAPRNDIMTQPRKLCLPFSRASLCRYILHTFLVAAKRKLCFPFSRASLCRYILHTFLVAAKRKLCFPFSRASLCHYRYLRMVLETETESGNKSVTFVVI